MYGACSLPIAVLVLIATSPTPIARHLPAWPHRAILTAGGEKPVAFSAYTLGGTLIVAVDAAGNRIATPAGRATLRALTPRDTIFAETPADFPLDLAKGAVVFVARDSVRLRVGRNPYGQLDQVIANGRRFTVRLVDDRFVIDSR